MQIVLVHGAWHGGWCWKRVLPLLRAAGHDVFAPTLTGLGERKHLLTPDIGLETHVADVLGVIETEGLSDVLLVGHSYAGIVVTAVADRLSGTGAVSRLAFVDAMPPHDGEAWRDFHSEEARKATDERVAKEGQGRTIPSRPATAFGISDPADLAWADARLSAQPYRTYLDRVKLTKGGYEPYSRTYVDSTHPSLPTLAIAKARVRAEPGWRIETLPTGHDPMITMPRELSTILLKM